MYVLSQISAKSPSIKNKKFNFFQWGEGGTDSVKGCNIFSKIALSMKNLTLEKGGGRGLSILNSNLLYNW